jgi:hypothetical protein
MPAADFLGAVRALVNGRVDFLLVGGFAAVLHGAPVTTFDIDIVPARDEENLSRLLRVLDGLDAVYRIGAERRLKPDLSHLSSPGHHNLMTRCGPLDVLGTIGRGLDYHDLIAHTVEMALGEGLQVRVLNLETLIVLKEELGNEKDLAVLPVLRRTLEEKRKSG